MRKALLCEVFAYDLDAPRMGLCNIVGRLIFRRYF